MPAPRSLKQVMQDQSYLPQFCTADTLILCCGNRLFGDDGFGPAVAERLLELYSIPDHVYVADAGTGARKLLFTLCLSTDRPRRIVLVDAVDKQIAGGEIFEIDLEEIPPQKIDDFSLHQVPSSNLLHDLKQAGIEVRVLVCQTEYIPDHIEPGLSEKVSAAVLRMCAQVAREYFGGTFEGAEIIRAKNGTVVTVQLLHQ